MIMRSPFGCSGFLLTCLHVIHFEGSVVIRENVAILLWSHKNIKKTCMISWTDKFVVVMAMDL